MKSTNRRLEILPHIYNRSPFFEQNTNLTRLKPTLHRPSIHIRHLSMDDHLPEMYVQPKNRLCVKPLVDDLNGHSFHRHKVRLSPVAVTRKYSNHCIEAHYIGSRHSLPASNLSSYRSSPKAKEDLNKTALFPNFNLTSDAEPFGVTFGNLANKCV